MAGNEDAVRAGRVVPALLVAVVVAALVFAGANTDSTEEVRVGAGTAAAGGATAAGAATADGVQTWRTSLRPEERSGLSGTAVLTVAGQGRTRIEVVLSGAPPDALPAHLHVGSCGTHDPRPRYALTSVQSGRSESVVPVDLQDLISQKFVIKIQNTRRSATVACGELVGG